VAEGVPVEVDGQVFIADAAVESNHRPTDYELRWATSGSVDLAAVREGCFGAAGLHLPSWGHGSGHAFVTRAPNDSDPVRAQQANAGSKRAARRGA
jgi:hypothetical protein